MSMRGTAPPPMIRNGSTAASGRSMPRSDTPRPSADAMMIGLRTGWATTLRSVTTPEVDESRSVSATGEITRSWTRMTGAMSVASPST